MNVGVMGWWHHDNQGDIKILENVTRALSPHRVVPIDLPFSLNDDALQRLNLLDFVILGGGGLFHDAPPIPFDSFDAWGDRLLAPIGVAGVGIDAVLPAYRRSVGALVEQARFFYVRDSVSSQLVAHPKIKEMPDLSFLYPLHPSAGTRTPSQRTAVCGINLRQGLDLAVDRWIETLCELPLQLRGIPFSTFDTWHELEILQRIDEACATTFDPVLYEGLDLMVGTAFHSVVFAIQAGVPTIAVAYAPKVQRLMTEIGLGDYVLDPDEWHKLPGLIARVLDEHSRLVDHLRETAASLTKLSRQTMVDIKNEISLAARPRPCPAPRASIVVVGTESDVANQTTILSCLEQTYVDLEIILVGNNIKVCAGNVPVRHQAKTVSGNPSESVGERLNRAFAHATGEYLSWTVAGNAYALDAIACMADRLQQDPACDMVYAGYYEMQSENRLAGSYSVYEAHKLWRRDVVGPCFLYRRRLFEEIRPFSAGAPLVAYDYWLRAHKVFHLQPVQARLFYALVSGDVSAERQAESQTRQLWRSSKPWPLRVFWRVADAELVDRYFILPLAAVLRKTVAFCRRLSARVRIQGAFLALGALLFSTDIGRWRRVSRQVPAWDVRNKLIAELIPGNSMVLDLGSGAQTLGKYLEPRCEYQPCDVVKSSDNVLLCDFNQDVYPAVQKIYDYVVCSGVLEYIRRPSEFFRIVSGFGKEMLVSYAPFQEGDSKLSRLSEGWVNHFTQVQLEMLFDALGLEWSVIGRWQDQIVYRVWREPVRVTIERVLAHED